MDVERKTSQNMQQQATQVCQPCGGSTARNRRKDHHFCLLYKIPYVDTCQRPYSASHTGVMKGPSVHEDRARTLQQGVPVKGRATAAGHTRPHTRTHKQGKGSALPAARIGSQRSQATSTQRAADDIQPGIPVGRTASTLCPGSTNHVSKATDFLSTCPHTPRVEEPHPATLCRTRNSTDDSMLSTGQKIMHKTPCIRSANPKQQLPKSVDN